MNINERVITVLQGDSPDRIPFISRMDFWYEGLKYQHNLPEGFSGVSLSEIHRSIGLGQEEWQMPCAFRYRNLEMVVTRCGQQILHEYEPEIEFFPDLWGIIPTNQTGETTTELITPNGKLECVHRVMESSLRNGTSRPQLVKPPVSEPDDFKVYEYIIEHSEFVPRYEEFNKKVEELGGDGFLVPSLNRVPFQSLLIDVMGEMACFYALYDTPKLLERILAVIDQQTVELLENLSSFDYPYIEFIDNLDGFMTNPRLFKKFVLPSYQKYADIAHSQGKMIGSHTDGNLKNLVSLLSGSGLDVCESFTPAPLTDCTFEEAFESWQSGPVIWGGIPSYYLEQRVGEEDMQNYLESILALVEGRPIILGIADAVMSDSNIERVRWIAEKIERISC